MKIKLLFASIVIIQLTASDRATAVWKGKDLSLIDKIKQYAVICPGMRVIQRSGRGEDQKEFISKLGQACAESGDVNVVPFIGYEKSTVCSSFDTMFKKYYRVHYAFKLYDLNEVTHPGQMKYYIDDMKNLFRLTTMDWIRDRRHRMYADNFIDGLIRWVMVDFQVKNKEICCRLERLSDAAVEIGRLKKYSDDGINDLNKKFSILREKFKRLQKSYNHPCGKMKLIVRVYVLYMYVELYVHRGFRDDRDAFEILGLLRDYFERLYVNGGKQVDLNRLMELIKKWPNLEE